MPLPRSSSTVWHLRTYHSDLDNVCGSSLNTVLHVGHIGYQFLRQRALLDAETTGCDFLGIQHRHPAVFLPIHVPVNLHGRRRIGRLHHQRQPVVTQISFCRIPPRLIPNVQKIRQHMDPHRFSGLLPQGFAQQLLCLMQLPGVGFPALF